MSIPSLICADAFTSQYERSTVYLELIRFYIHQHVLNMYIYLYVVFIWYANKIESKKKRKTRKYGNNKKRRRTKKKTVCPIEMKTNIEMIAHSKEKQNFYQIVWVLTHLFSQTNTDVYFSCFSSLFLFLLFYFILSFFFLLRSKVHLSSRKRTKLFPIYL